MESSPSRLSSSSSGWWCCGTSQSTKTTEEEIAPLDTNRDKQLQEVIIRQPAPTANPNTNLKHRHIIDLHSPCHGKKTAAFVKDPYESCCDPAGVFYCCTEDSSEVPLNPSKALEYAKKIAANTTSRHTKTGDIMPTQFDIHALRVALTQCPGACVKLDDGEVTANDILKMPLGPCKLNDFPAQSKYPLLCFGQCYDYKFEIIDEDISADWSKICQLVKKSSISSIKISTVSRGRELYSGRYSALIGHSDPGQANQVGVFCCCPSKLSIHTPKTANCLNTYCCKKTASLPMDSEKALTELTAQATSWLGTSAKVTPAKIEYAQIMLKSAGKVEVHQVEHKQDENDPSVGVNRPLISSQDWGNEEQDISKTLTDIKSSNAEVSSAQRAYTAFPSAVNAKKLATATGKAEEEATKLTEIMKHRNQKSVLCAAECDRIEKNEQEDKERRERKVKVGERACQNILGMPLGKTGMTLKNYHTEDVHCCTSCLCFRSRENHNLQQQWDKILGEIIKIDIKNAEKFIEESNL